MVVFSGSEKNTVKGCCLKATSFTTVSLGKHNWILK
jgi:hypothetical protein